MVYIKQLQFQRRGLGNNIIMNEPSNKLAATGYILNCQAIIDSQASKQVFLDESIIKTIVDSI